MTTGQQTATAENRARAGASGQPMKGTIDYLLESMQRRSDFPVLSESIRSLNQLADSREQDVRSLSSVIIGDFALTNKMLKVVNSAYYSSFSGKIGSISRAIVVLGIEAVRTLAASLVFLEHLSDKSQVSRLRDQISAAIFSATLARHLAGALGMENTEGSFLCGMLQSLGGILVTYYLPQEAAQIEGMLGREAAAPEAVQKRVLGMTFEQIGVAVARHWNFPATITDGMLKYDLASGNDPKSDAARLRLVASFANEAAVVIGRAGLENAIRTGGSLSECLKILKLDARQFSAVVGEARKEFREFHCAFGGEDHPAPTTFMRRLVDGAGEVDDKQSIAEYGTPVVLAAEDTVPVSSDERDRPPAADPDLIMTEGLQEISSMLAGDGGSVNQVFNVVLETLYRAMGFRHVVLFLKDARRQRYLARLGFGQDIDRFITGFSFPAGYHADVFHAALKNAVDLYIEDTRARKIRDDLPDWYFDASPAGSFILLPVVLNHKPLGLIYADHLQTRGLNCSGNQLNLMKALRNQVLLALRARF